jgi:CHAT domain-containing protein/Tfp pilus assembly protein PilF
VVPRFQMRYPKEAPDLPLDLQRNGELDLLKTPKILVCCLSAFLFLGGARVGLPLSAPQAQRPSAESARHASELQASILRGAELYGKGQYQEASQVFQSVFENAKAFSLPRAAGRALGNLGGCQFALHQYRAALRSFLEARRLSESAGDTGTVAAWDANIADLYMEAGEVEAAAEWASRTLKSLRGPYSAVLLPRLQIELAILRANEGRMAEAQILFRQGIESADRAGDREMYAIGWNRLGLALLTRGDLSKAEIAFLEGYRTSKLHHLELDASYRNLGWLRLEQGDLASALVLLDRAIEIAGQPKELMPTWDVYYLRGRVHLAEGRTAEALSDLRMAQRLGRAWRWSAPLNESVQVGAEGWLDKVHSALVDAGNRRYLETHDPALKQETFTANEENRAVSLRALWNVPKRSGELSASDLPPAYWQALAHLQRAEAAALQSGNSGDLAAARADLIRMEASLGGDLRPLPDDLPAAIRRKLDPDTALFSFHLGTPVSWVWALGREGFEVYALPSRAAIEEQVRTVTDAIRSDRHDAAALSANLYRAIFGPVAPGFRNAQRWLLALDGGLFDLPLAALIEEMDPAPANAPAYVVARHTIELIPGAAYWLESSERPDPRLSPLFVGIGDPIYNRADARAARFSYGHSPSLILPRLVASGTEVENSAKAWHGRSVLLRGSDASRKKLAALLDERPAVVHVATHYVESADQNHYSLIALSLAPSGDTEVLSPLEISAWRIHTGLVVLSGCHSAAGAALPGEGVLGLTRAWLAAGAHSVVGSLWETQDDDGALFGELYRNLRAIGSLDAGQALREAQLKMIRSGGRLGRPSYWGTYFAVANQGKAVIPQ